MGEIVLLITFAIFYGITGSFWMAAGWTAACTLVCFVGVALLANWIDKNNIGKGKIVAFAVIVVSMVAAGFKIYGEITKARAAKQAAEIAKGVEEVEARVWDFATKSIPEMWAQYMNAKESADKMESEVKLLMDDEVPDRLKGLAAECEKRGMDRSKIVEEMKRLGIKRRDEMKSRRDGLLKEIQEKHQAFLRAEAETKKRQEVERVAAERKQKDESVREQRREEMLKEFALKEAPQMWQTYVGLGAAIENQSSRMEELRKTLVSFEQNPDEDADYMELVSTRQAMVESRDSLHEKIQKAYLQYCKFLATPGTAEVESLHRKVMEDAMQEADAAKVRFKEMMSEK